MHLSSINAGRRFRRASLYSLLHFALILNLILPRIANAQKAYAPLDKLLGKTNYFQLLPYGTDYRPGGLVVVCAGNPKYKVLPRGVNYPKPSEQQAVFPASGDKVSTTMGGLAAFLSNAMKLKFTGTSDNATDIQQINAQNNYIEYENDVIESAAVQDQVKSQLNSLCRVFVVTSVLTTRILEITSSKAVGGSIQVNGKDLPECKRTDYEKRVSGTGSKLTTGAPSDKKDEENKKPAPSEATSSAKTKDEKASATDLPKIASAKNDPKSAADTLGAAGSAAPAYAIYGCRSTANKLTLASDIPVAFALQMNEIRLKDGKLVVDSTPAEPAKVKLSHPIVSEPTQDFSNVAD